MSDIQTLAEDTPIHEPFLLVQKDARTTRKDKPYFFCVWRNEDGDVKGNIWEAASGESLSVGDVVLVAAKINVYRGAKELNIRSLERVDGDHPLRRLLNRPSPIPVERLERRFRRLTDRLSEPSRLFLDKVFADAYPQEAFFEAPAAVRHHHAHLSGLLRHVCEVGEVALGMALAFEGAVDTDRVLLGAILHDVDKINEYAYADRPAAMSTHGRLLGHIVGGTVALDRVWRTHRTELEAAGFTEADAIHVMHVVVSHHRERAWGSPVEPATAEAMIVHNADMASATVRPMLDTVADGQPDADGWIDGRVYAPAGPEQADADADGGLGLEVRE